MDKKKFRVLRGLRDLTFEDVEKLNYVISTIRDLFKLYGYKEIVTPTLEEASLFEAKAGEELRHRMYTFRDLGKRRVTLRPEMTPSVARYYINHLLSYPKPIRLGYIANCFRYDEPQYGRYREFWQAGFELIGSSNPEADAEIIIIADTLIKNLGFIEAFIKINHIGILKSIFKMEGISENIQNIILSLFDKAKYDDAIELLKANNVSKNCINTVEELIRLRGVDFKSILQDAEKILNAYPQSLQSIANLKDILEILESSERKISIHIDLGFARGLEYYTGLIFECFTPKFKLALGGGGRYDNLIETFNGPPTPAVGYAPGIDRIILAMEEEGLRKQIKDEHKVIIIPVSRNIVYHAFKIAEVLREQKIPVEIEVMGRSIKKSLSYANSMNFSYAIIIGEKEISEGKITLKNLKKNEQYNLTVEETINILKSK
ncbi:MAG: histidine--tRNA ligase [Candidatus Methanomethylicia archaeon]